MCQIKPLILGIVFRIKIRSYKWYTGYLIDNYLNVSFRTLRSSGILQYFTLQIDTLIAG